MVVQQKMMTAEEFWEAYAGKPFELIEGEVVEIVPGGYEHGDIMVTVAFHLRSYIENHPIGRIVGGETDFWLSEVDMRAADVAFISNERLKTITEPKKYLPFAPDLAVEVVSPGDTASEIEQKVTLYLKAGARRVWVIYPDLKHVRVHYPDATSKTIPADGALDGEDILPGLRIAVVSLFPPQPSKE